MPTKSKGEAEIAAAESPGGNHIFASLRSNAVPAARAKTANTQLIHRKIVFIMDKDVALGLI